MESLPSPNKAMSLAGLGLEKFLQLEDHSPIPSSSASFSSSTSSSPSPDVISTSPTETSLQQSPERSCPQPFPPISLHEDKWQPPMYTPPTCSSSSWCSIMSDIHYRLLQMESSADHVDTARRLRHFYVTSTAEIERQRRQQLLATEQWQAVEIERYFDVQHRHLVDRIWPCLLPFAAKYANLTPCVPFPPTTVEQSSHPASSTDPPPAGFMTPTAKLVLLEWYTQHEQHPYPSNDTAVVLAHTAKVSVNQVKKWFANRRRRAKNTKPMAVVVAKRYSPYQVRKDVEL